MGGRRRRGTGRVVVAVALVAAALVAGSLYRASRSPLPALEPESRLRSYRIVYAVEARGQPRRTQDVSVLRPFHSREIVRDESGVVSATVSNDRGQWHAVGGSTPMRWSKLGAAAARASADLHVGAALRNLVEAGRSEVRGTERHAGRQCTTVRTGGPVGAAPSAPTTRDYADICVDEAGLVLAERWYAGGRLLQERIVRSLDLAPTFDDATFAAPPAATEAGGRMPMARADLERPLRFTPPPGYRLAGGHVWLGADAQPRFVWMFADSGDLIEYQEGTSIGDVGPPDAIVAAGRRPAGLYVGFASSQLVVAEPDGVVLTVRAGDPATLEELASALGREGSR